MIECFTLPLTTLSQSVPINNRKKKDRVNALLENIVKLNSDLYIYIFLFVCFLSVSVTSASLPGVGVTFAA